jgi:hypothetical protein
MDKCECLSVREFNRIVAAALGSAVKDLTQEARALSILRNGGWEQRLRNQLLVNLEKNNRVLSFF